MEHSQHIRDLHRWLDLHRRHCWRPHLSPRTGSAASLWNSAKALIFGGGAYSYFGGQPYLFPDEQEPTCGRCGEPLALFLQLQLSTLPNHVRKAFGSGLLQVFLCHDQHCLGRLAEPFDPSRLMRVIPREAVFKLRLRPLKKTLSRLDIVSWQWRGDYPDAEDAEVQGLELNYDAQGLLVRVPGGSHSFVLNDADYQSVLTASPDTKLAGWPHWVHGRDYPMCPDCGADMINVIFQVAAEDLNAVGLPDAAMGYLVQCPEHRNLISFHAVMD